MTTIIRNAVVTRLRKGLAACSLGCLLFWLTGCEPELVDDPIPFVPFSAVTINLNLPEYQQLKTTGWMYMNDLGVRGVIVHRKSDQEYVAYERNCSYTPNAACATVEVHLSNFYLQDQCCGSTFSLSTGLPTGGPAWRPLRQYETVVSGTELTITDQVLE